MSVNDEKFDAPNELLCGYSGGESIWHGKTKIGTSFSVAS
jgi:hypothetical protein